MLVAVGAGITQGFAFALAAVGFNVVYSGTKTVNFANGQFMLLGGYIVWWLYAMHHVPFPLAVVCAVASGVALGTIVDRVIIARVRKATLLTQVVALVGVASILDGLFMRYFGPDAKNIPAYADAKASVPGLGWSHMDLEIIVVTAIVLSALVGSVYGTQMGTKLRATADNATAAALLGINPSRVALASWCLGGGITALAGAMLLPKLLVSPDVGFVLTFAAFAAVVLGGFGSFSGAAVGGLLIGVTQSLVAYKLSGGYDAIVSAVVMLIVLAVAPRGLVGERA